MQGQKNIKKCLWAIKCQHKHYRQNIHVYYYNKVNELAACLQQTCSTFRRLAYVLNKQTDIRLDI